MTDFPVGNWSVVPSGTKMWVRDTATVNFDSLGGDSGGPVFYYFDGSTSGPTVSALDTHVHSEDGAGANEGWFSPIVVGSDDYLADANYGYRPCLNAACTN